MVNDYANHLLFDSPLPWKSTHPYGLFCVAVLVRYQKYA